MIGELIGGAGSILAAILGGQAQDQANAENWNINLYNQRQRKKERQQGIDYADMLRKEQKLGATDAYGNKTSYVEGEGWKTVLAPLIKSLQDRYYREELPQQQDQFSRTAARSREDDAEASALLQQFKDVNRENPRDVEQQLSAVANRGIADATQSSISAAMRNAARRGLNANEALTTILREDASKRASAGADAKLKSTALADENYSNRRNQLGSLYSAFSSKAGNPLQAVSDQSGKSQAANSLMTSFANNLQQGNSAQAAALAKQGGTLGNAEPFLGTANTFGAVGSALGGIGKSFEGKSDDDSINALLRKYLASGGGSGGSGSSLYDSMNQRIRSGTGNF